MIIVRVVGQNFELETIVSNKMYFDTVNNYQHVPGPSHSTVARILTMAECQFKSLHATEEDNA